MEFKGVQWYSNAAVCSRLSELNMDKIIEWGDRCIIKHGGGRRPKPHTERAHLLRNTGPRGERGLYGEEWLVE